MRRTLVVYGSLLTLLLVGSYLSWTAKPDTDAEEGVVLLEVDPDQIETIHYVSADLDVMLTASEDERGRYLWAKLVKQQARAPETKKPEPAPEPDATASGTSEGDAAAETEGAPADGPVPAQPEPAPPEPEPVVEAVTMEFAAGSAGDELLEALAPLRAKRELAQLDEGKLAELGLAESSATLTLTVAGRESLHYEIGESEFASGNLYLRDPASGRVWVVDAQSLGALTKADKRLPNRTLFAAKLDEIVSARVEADGRTATLEHRNREDPERQFWAIEGAEAADETAQAWMQKFFRLRAVSYVAADSQPADPTPRFEVEVRDEKGTATRVQVLSATRDGEQVWYARSEHTRGLVELTPALAEETAQDVGAVLE